MHVASAHGFKRWRNGKRSGLALRQGFVPQGIGADMIATIDGYSREDVDAYAMESQRVPRMPVTTVDSISQLCR